MAANKEIIQALRTEFKKSDRPENKMDYQRWFKEKLKDPIRFKRPVIRKAANEIFKQAKNIPKEDLLDTCEVLFESERSEEWGTASIWATRISNQLDQSDYKRLENWLKKYVDNWGRCDSLCCGAFGDLILRYPDLTERTQNWAKSKNRWLRRASAVILIPSLNKGKLLNKAFEVADILLLDDDDIVQKGYGWMLKVAADKYQNKVFRYIFKHKAEMPRTALRYAIEKMPKELRQKAMSHD